MHLKNLFKTLAIILGLSVSMSSCMKDGEVFDPQAQLDLEKPIIESYVKKNYPNAQQLETTGIWYEIINEGEPDSYEYTIKDTLNASWIRSEAIMNYKGRLVSDGSIFDETKDITKGDTLPLLFNFNNGQTSVIGAFNIAIFPKKMTVNDKELDLGELFEDGAQNGSKFRIIAPSYYGYGNRQNGKIPANSPLDFEVDILKMRDYVEKK